MSDERSPVDRALDLFVYAPVGLALSVRESLPGLVERGRQQVTGQVGMARVIGQFAVRQGQAEAEKAFTKAREQAQVTLEQLGVLHGAPPAGPRNDAGTRPPTANGSGTASSTTSTAASPAAGRPTSGPGAAGLAIPDYDSLSASQVVPRLSGLSPEELEAVRDYEAGHRGRKTILSRVAQLRAS